jgi:hypothetical protein
MSKVITNRFALIFRNCCIGEIQTINEIRALSDKEPLKLEDVFPDIEKDCEDIQDSFEYDEAYLAWLRDTSTIGTKFVYPKPEDGYPPADDDDPSDAEETIS